VSGNGAIAGHVRIEVRGDLFHRLSKCDRRSNFSVLIATA